MRSERQIRRSRQRERGAAIIEGALVMLPFLLSFAAFLLVSLGFVSIGMVTHDVIWAEIERIKDPVLPPGSGTLQSYAHSLAIGHGPNRNTVAASIASGQPYKLEDKDALRFANFAAGAAQRRRDAFGIPGSWASATQSPWATYSMTGAGVSVDSIPVLLGPIGSVEVARKLTVGRTPIPFLYRFIVFAAMVRRPSGQEGDLPGTVIGTAPVSPAPALLEPTVACVVEDCDVATAGVGPV